MSETKICTDCGNELPLSEFYKKGQGHFGYCKKCHNIRSAKWSSENRERRNQIAKESRDKDPERQRAVRDRHYQNNREKENERCRKWRSNNPEKMSDINRAYYENHAEERREQARAYRSENPHVTAEMNLRYRTRMAKCKPSWADDDKIAEIYRAAKALNEAFGTDYQVDHIIPIFGKNVCGLHIESNLQIITADANRRKSNKFDEAALA